MIWGGTFMLFFWLWLSYKRDKIYQEDKTLDNMLCTFLAEASFIFWLGVMFIVWAIRSIQ